MHTLLLENVPTGSVVGLDLYSWTAGQNFRGWRDVDAGVHCLHLLPRAAGPTTPAQASATATSNAATAAAFAAAAPSATGADANTDSDAHAGAHANAYADLEVEAVADADGLRASHQQTADVEQGGLAGVKAAVWLYLPSHTNGGDDAADGSDDAEDEHAALRYMWDARAGTLVRLPRGDARAVNPLFLLQVPTAATARSQSAAYMDADERLQRNEQGKSDAWRRITADLTQTHVHRLVGVGVPVDSMTGSAADAAALSNTRHRQSLGTSTSTSTDDDTAQEHRVEAELEVCFNFTAIDLKRSYPQGATPADVTRLSLDKSWLLRDVLRRISQQGFLAELQFCYASVLLYTNYAAFEQYATLVRLLCGCTTIDGGDVPFFTRCVRAVSEGVEQATEDLVAQILSPLLPREFRRLLKLARAELRDEVEILLDILERLGGYASESDSEGEDEQPTVVELDA